VQGRKPRVPIEPFGIRRFSALHNTPEKATLHG